MQLIKRFFGWLWSKKRWVLVILVVGGLIGYWAKQKFFPEKPTISYESIDHVVGTGDLAKTLSLAGKTQFANAQKLTFISEGRVTSVKVKVGDQVKKGQVLATISTDNLDKDVEDLKRNLKNAQQDLKKAIEKSNKELDILKAQSEYDLLLIQKQTLPSTLQLDTQTKASAFSEAQASIKLAETTIKTKERELKDKQKELADVQSDYEKLQAGDKGALLSTPETTRNWNNKMLEYIREFRNEANKLQKTLDDYDAVVKLSNNYTADDRNIYLGAKNDAAMNRSKAKYWEVSAYVGKLQKLYEDYSKLPLEKITKNQILSGYSIFTQLGNEFKEWGKINIDAFGDSIETADMPKSKILGYVETFGRAYEIQGETYLDKNVNIVDTLAKLKTAETPLDEIKEKLEKVTVEVDQAQVALTKAKNDLETAKNKTEQEGLKYQLSQQENAVKAAELEQKIKEAREKLDDAKSGETQREALEKSRDAVDAAQLALTTKMKEYDNYKITANFDGVVTKVNMQIGDSIGNSRNTSDNDAKYIYVETPDLLEVKLEVDQIDITKIQIGMDVEVYIDAFEGKVYTGHFAEVDTMPEGNSYKAKVVFKKSSPDDRIFGGMSANVKAVLESVKNQILVPNPAIADNEKGEKIVRYKEKSGEWTDKVVEVGMSDDTNSVILSGLNIGDTIKEFYMNETSLNNAGLGGGNMTPGAGGVQMSEGGGMYYETAQ